MLQIFVLFILFKTAMLKKIFFIIFLTAMLNETSIFAQTESDFRISVFKNGSAFFAKKVKLNAETGTAHYFKLPNAAYGLLWFNAENNTLKYVKTFVKTSESNRKITSLKELVRENKGKKATVSYATGQAISRAEGVLACENGLVVVKSSEKTVIFEEQFLLDCTFSEQPNFSFTEKKSEDCWEMNFAKNNKEQIVDFFYLQRGLAWFPSYQIELLSEDKARLSFSTQIVNEAEDFENASLQLVVGVPNFLFENLKSPLCSTESVYTLLSQLSGAGNTRFRPTSMTNMISQQRMSYDSYNSPGFNEEAEESETEATGEQAGDLFFYDAPAGISLKKGEKMAFDIFRSECSYQHSYDVQLPQTRSDGSFSSEFKPTESKLPEVWHSVHIKNETKTPWTTAPIFALSKLGNAKPLSQDKLTYTPVGAKAKIKLTIAADIAVKEEEREIERKQVKFKDGVYDQITVEAKITVNNYKKSSVKINIGRAVMGETIKSDSLWKVEKKTGYYYNANNKNNQINWEIDAPAGGEKVITYSYMTFVRR